jgi:hypothetical protein
MQHQLSSMPISTKSFVTVMLSIKEIQISLELLKNSNNITSKLLLNQILIKELSILTIKQPKYQNL